jgi:hypothetical protein
MLSLSTTSGATDVHNYVWIMLPHYYITMLHWNNCCHGVSVLLHVIPRDQQVMVHLHDGH